MKFLSQAKKRLFSCFALVSILFVSLSPVFASTNNFYIRAVLPENQQDNDVTYFDLQLAPGASQLVQVEITNPDDQEITAHINLFAASTQTNGLIAYQADNGTGYPLRPITDFASALQNEITVPANSSKTADIRIDMPEEEFEGVVLGGISVQAAAAQEDAGQSESGGIQLTNEYNYIIGLKVAQTDAEVQPDFDLTGITPSSYYGKTAIIVNLQNNASRIIKHMEVSADVYAQGSSNALYSLSLPRAEMAPDTTGDFVIMCNDEPLRAGKYRLHMTALYEEQLWEWDQEFEILSDDADSVNDNSYIARDFTLWYIIGGLLILLLLILFFFLLRRRRNKDEDQNGSL